MALKVVEDCCVFYDEGKIYVGDRSEQGEDMAEGFADKVGFKHDCTLFNDSQSMIHLERNLTFHARMKHIDIIYHFICLFLEDRQMPLEKVHTNLNLVDMPTKVVPLYKVKLCVTLICLR